MRRVPATVITGLLGAGKTSLVRHLLAHAQGRRLAVVVNEFGELGIDRGLLLGCGDAACGEDDIVELANGCLCCTVAEDFLPTLARLLDRAAPPDHIFGRRLEVLTLAVIAQLHARGNFHRIAREWFYGDPPATELGRGVTIRAKALLSRGKTLYFAASVANKACISLSLAGVFAAMSLYCE